MLLFARRQGVFVWFPIHLMFMLNIEQIQMLTSWHAWKCDFENATAISVFSTEPK